MSSADADIVRMLREYAHARDKDVGFSTGLTDTMREAAARLEASGHGSLTADDFAHFAAAIERREDLIENVVDRLFELWHQSDSDQPFTPWAGITDEQYAAYITDRYEDEDLERCKCRAEGNHPHKGPIRLLHIDINAQPSGHGSYTMPTTIRVCEAHAKWFLKGHHLNAWPKDAS